MPTVVTVDGRSADVGVGAQVARVRAPEGTIYHVPEDGHTFQSTEVEMQEFLYGIVRYLKPELIFESGSCMGYGAMALGMACEANEYGNVVSCEPLEVLYMAATETCKHLPRVRIVQAKSVDVPELREADFVFSDSEWEARLEEFELAKYGSTFVVHDTRIQPKIGAFVRKHGGLTFERGRGFGIITKR